MQKMMKLSDTHYILVDDEGDIKVGDIVVEKLLTGGYELFEIHTLNDIDKSTQKKVTHSTQPLEEMNHGNYKSKVFLDIKPLSLSEVKELLGVVDVEKKAKDYLFYDYQREFNVTTNDEQYGVVTGYIKGYHEALEDNKEKKYTEEDMRKAIEMARESHDYLYGYSWSKEQIIQGLQSKTEWECIIDEQGKLKLI